MATFTSFNNSLVVDQSEFKWGKFTDENSIYNWFKKDTFTNYKGMLALWNQRKLVNTPLLNMTELRNNVVHVNGANGIFSYSIPYELECPHIIEDITDVSLTKPGIDGQKFKILLSDNCFTNTDRITTDLMNGQELFITEDEIYPEGNGWVYTVELVSFDKKNSYYNKDFLKPGTEYMKVSNSNGEQSTQKSSVSTQFGSIKLQNQLSGHRSVYHWITAYADMLKVASPQMAHIGSMYGNLKNPNSTMVMYNLDENGQPVKGSLSWMSMVEAMLWAEMKKMEEMDLMWSKGGIVSGSGRTPIRVGMGLYEQMRNGNRVKYTRLTKALLDSVFGGLFQNTGIPISERRVKVQCGTAAFIEVSKIIENEFGKTPFVVNANDVGLLTGDSQNLKFGYRFTSMQFPTAGWVEFEINQAFDNKYTNTMNKTVGEYPLFSHTLAVFDVTDTNATNAAAKMDTNSVYEPGFNEGSNLVLVKPEGMDNVVWGYELGTQAPLGYNNGPIMSSSQRDGYAIWMKSISSIWLKDATRSVLLEKNA